MTFCVSNESNSFGRWNHFYFSPLLKDTHLQSPSMAGDEGAIQQPCTGLTAILERVLEGSVLRGGLEQALKPVGDPAPNSPSSGRARDFSLQSHLLPPPLSSPSDDPRGPRKNTGWASMQEAPPSTEHAGGGRFVLLPILSFHLSPHVRHNIVRGGCHRILQHDK